MQTKTLGRTGLALPIVGIGTAWTGIPSLHNLAQVDIDLGVQTVIAAMEAGCTFFDTAPLYGRTDSETIIGLAFKQRPDLAKDCIVTTKAGRYHEVQDYRFDTIIRSVEASRERLGLDALDVVYIHDAMGYPMADVMGKDGALGALRHLQDQEIVRYIGTAANDPDTNILYIETGEFDAAVIAESWSLLNQLAEQRLFAAAEQHNVGLVTATPIERGLLATGPIDGVDYVARNFSPAVLDHVRQIQAVCDRHGVMLLAAALQWCTRHPLIASTIPGARIPAEAVADITAGREAIPETFWDDLAPLVKHWEAGVDR